MLRSLFRNPRQVLARGDLQHVSEARHQMGDVVYVVMCLGPNLSRPRFETRGLGMGSDSRGDPCIRWMDGWMPRGTLSSLRAGMAAWGEEEGEWMMMMEDTWVGRQGCAGRKRAREGLGVFFV